MSHTELEEELHETAHIDYDRVAIVRASYVTCPVDRDLPLKGAERSRT